MYYLGTKYIALTMVVGKLVYHILKINYRRLKNLITIYLMKNLVGTYLYKQSQSTHNFSSAIMVIFYQISSWYMSLSDMIRLIESSRN